MTRILILLFVFIQITLLSKQTMAEKISVNNAYIRMMPPMMNMTAAFMQIKNNSSSIVILVDLKSNLSKFTQLHESVKNKNGAYDMIHLETLNIKPHSSVYLQRGGKHVMFMNLNEKLKLNNTYNVKFYFKDGSKLEKQMSIKEL